MTDAIRLAKHWNVREGLRVKTFVLELLIIDVLKDKKSKPLDEQMKHFWQTLKDKATELKVEDPANPTGNDLSAIFNDGVKQTLKAAASRALDTIETLGWESVFGSVQTAKKAHRIEIIERTAAAVAAPARPWLR